MHDPLPQTFYLRPTVEVARDLLGALLVRTLPGGETLSGLIAETEAYVTDDPASHAYRGRTPRNGVMWGPAGHAYVYRSYGIHEMLNFVTEREGVAEAVLIRAIEPVAGIETMRKARGGIMSRFELTNGPGKLAQALEITRINFNGIDITSPHSALAVYERGTAPDIEVTTRVGITKGVELPYRFLISGSAYVSRGRPSVAPA